MVTSSPYFPLNVRREVAPLFAELCRWLVAERRRLGRPPLTCSGGYNKRLVRGSTSSWSNHSWALAGDFCVAQNPMQDTLRTDMPPGTSAKAKSLGMVWGGDYSGRKDPMHFEFVGSPADARRLVAGLDAPPEEDDMTPDQSRQLAEVHRELTMRLPNRMGLKNPDGKVGDDTLFGTALWAQHDAWMATQAARQAVAEIGALRGVVVAAVERGDLTAEQVTAAAKDGAAAALAERIDSARVEITPKETA